MSGISANLLYFNPTYASRMGVSAMKSAADVAV